MAGLFTCGSPRLVGVVHLLPLPGSPAPSPGLSEVIGRAVADARALWQGGAHGLIVENLGDAPYALDRVAPWVVAAMTRVVLAVRAEVPELHLGVNVLRNDALAALSVAAAVEADFIRVNVHVGAMVTDQGLVQGRARETLLERRRLGATTRIAADVLVKHAEPLGQPDLGQVAADTVLRGRADALIITGSGTGRPLDPGHLEEVRARLPHTPLWAGSGVDPERAGQLGPLVDAAIVGTWLHRDAQLDAPLDAERVATLREALCG